MDEKDNLRLMGQRIAIRRTEMRMSQEDLAEKADLSTRTIYTAENGVKALRADNIIKICEVLEMSPDYLLLGKLGNRENDELSLIFKKFTPKQIATIKDFLIKWEV